MRIGGAFQGNQFIAEIAQASLTIILLISITFIVGYLMRTTLGELFGARIDGVINFVPGLRIVYNAAKMAVETLSLIHI